MLVALLVTSCTDADVRAPAATTGPVPTASTADVRATSACGATWSWDEGVVNIDVTAAGATRARVTLTTKKGTAKPVEVPLDGTGAHKVGLVAPDEVTALTMTVKGADCAVRQAR